MLRLTKLTFFFCLLIKFCRISTNNNCKNRPKKSGSTDAVKHPIYRCSIFNIDTSDHFENLDTIDSNIDSFAALLQAKRLFSIEFTNQKLLQTKSTMEAFCLPNNGKRLKKKFNSKMEKGILCIL